MQFTQGEWRMTHPEIRDLAVRNAADQTPSPYRGERILIEAIGASLTHLGGSDLDGAASAFRFAASECLIIKGTQVLTTRDTAGTPTYSLRVWTLPNTAYTVLIRPGASA